MPTHDSSQCEVIDRLAEEFAARYRRGERPALQEYLDKYPELAEDIRAVFPALVEMEQVKEDHAEPASATAGAERPPLRQVGDYRILREVGRGAMGVVYEAEQVSLGRRVALKVLATHIAPDRQSVERFRREAKAAAKLHHTNIVPVFEVGQNGDICYYAMQFIQGQSLDQIFVELQRLRRPSQNRDDQHPETREQHEPDARRGEVDRLAHSLLTGCFQLGRAGALVGDVTEDHVAAPAIVEVRRAEPASPSSLDSAVLPGQTELTSVRVDRPHYFQSVARIGLQIANALAHAHARAIIHRDIKPSNLLLDVAGVVWIADFGLAKTRDNSLTNTGDVVGTLRYMAPERFKGEDDERADVYALGLTLYEMLVLQPAFAERDRLQLIDRIKTQEPARPRVVDRRVPRDLETIVLKAIDKEPKRRYQSAEEMAEDLLRFLADEPIKARRTSQLERLRLWRRRNPAVASLLGVVLLLLVCLTAGSLAAAFWLNQQRAALAAAEADRTENLYQSLVAQANASRFSRQVGQRFATLEAVGKAAELVRERHMPAERLDELRTLAIAALALPDFRNLRTWEGYPGGSKAWDADDRLRRYARADRDGNISLRWIDTDEEIARLELGRGDTGLLFSPGGRFLLALVDNRFRVWDVADSPPRPLRKGERHEFVFHPDGRHLLEWLGNGSMSLHDLADPKQQPLVLKNRSVPQVFDPAGNRLAALDAGKVHILDAKNGKVLSSIPESQPCQALAWHPSGNYLALVCSYRELHVWDLKRMRLMSVLKGCRNSGIHLAFTPDGERLLSGGWESVLRVWDWRTGRQLLQVSGGSNLKCRADGRLLIAQGGRLSLVELAGGREYRSFVQQAHAGNDVEYWHCRIHPGGRLAAAEMSDGDHFFDVETGEELEFLPQNRFSTIRFPGKDTMLVSATTGLFRWPMGVDQANPNRWRLGPPKLLDAGPYPNIDCDQKGEVIGQAAGNGAFVLRPDKSPLFLGPHADVRGVSLSPDGKYAATGTHNGDQGVKVWDTQTGRLLVHLPLGGMAGGTFSPDGKWLVAGGTCGHRLVKVGTWEQRPFDLETGVYFSPDNSLVAALGDRGVIRLLAPDTFREVARLEDPNQDRPGHLAFTADSGKLLVSSDDARALHLWDLRAIRTQLAELGLDWDLPPLPPALPPSSEPLKLHFDMGDYRQLVQAAALVRQAGGQVRAHKHADALKALREAIHIAPKYAMAHNDLAWLLSTGPKELRDPAQALAEARQAVALEPRVANYRNTLGVALYRSGKVAETIPVLERSLSESKGRSDAFDLFFLAMCHHRLGDAAKAKECRQLAADWFAKHKGRLSAVWIEELNAFQAEADNVMERQPGQEKK
jgi:serine/threonine protein kinase/WD40 repeat protein/Tfp pilus assembly protein PilF